MRILVWELVRGVLVGTFKKHSYAYKARDELQGEALRRGFDLLEKRFGIRTEVEIYVADE